MPRDTSIRKVLLIGSGPIVIGQAAEFDYAGTQAAKVLREDGIEVVLVNSNPATIMTDAAMADKIYLEPLSVDVVKRIIKEEKPDSLLGTLGGQTGLNLSMQLEKEGFLAENGVRLLGVAPDTASKIEIKRKCVTHRTEKTAKRNHRLPIFCIGKQKLCRKQSNQCFSKIAKHCKNAD